MRILNSTLKSPGKQLAVKRPGKLTFASSLPVLWSSVLNINLHRNCTEGLLKRTLLAKLPSLLDVVLEPAFLRSFQMMCMCWLEVLALRSLALILPPKSQYLLVQGQENQKHILQEGRMRRKILQLAASGPSSQNAFLSFSRSLNMFQTWGYNTDKNHDFMTQITTICDHSPRARILECEVKWPLGSITTHKASGGDGILVELFQILRDDAVKALHSICQQIWKTQQWPQDWKRSIFILIPKKQCQRMLKLPHNCTHFTLQQSKAQISPSQASTVPEP